MRSAETAALVTRATDGIRAATARAPWVRRLLAGAMFAAAFVAVALAIQNLYPLGVDWEYTFSRVDEHLRNPYALEAFTSPPWIVALLPHAWLPVRLGNAVNLLLNALLLAVAVRRFGGGRLGLALVFTSPFFFDLARTNNVDWIPLLATLLPPMWALPLLAVKPQSIGALALVWARRARWRPLLFAPLAAVVLLSLIVWGPWFRHLLNVTREMHNFAPWPLGLPVGAYLLWRAYRTDNEVLAGAATPLLVPYLAPYSYAAVLALLAGRYRREAAYLYFAGWAFVVIEMRRLAFTGWF